MKREILSTTVVAFFFRLTIAPSINANLSKQDDLVDLDVESDSEAVNIFNYAIVKPDEYGLLGGLSVKHAQKLISGRFCNPSINKLLSTYSPKNIDSDKLTWTLLLEPSFGEVYYPGVSGFFGFIYNYITFCPKDYGIKYPTKYQGHALEVKLGPEPPFIF